MVRDDGLAKRRGDDLGGLEGAGEGAGEQRIGVYLAGSRQPVAQPLGLGASSWGQPLIAAQPRHCAAAIALHIGVRLTVADEIEMGHGFLSSLFMKDHRGILFAVTSALYQPLFQAVKMRSIVIAQE